VQLLVDGYGMKKWYKKYNDGTYIRIVHGTKGTKSPEYGESGYLRDLPGGTALY